MDAVFSARRAKISFFEFRSDLGMDLFCFQYYEFDLEGGKLFMEYAPNKSLKEYIDNRPLEREWIVKFSAQVRA